jgi:hypothetical protein
MHSEESKEIFTQRIKVTLYFEPIRVIRIIRVIHFIEILTFTILQ